MVGGQWSDLLGEGRALGPDELDALHRRKTGALLAAALVMGALAADAPGGVVRALEEYGRHLGLAFQIADDILDATQQADTLGKNPSDVALGKSTYVALHGLEAARERAGAEAERAVAALRRVALDAPPLVALAEYVVARDR
jgi:geranylgeranyl pyrophosphate synthase